MGCLGNVLWFLFGGLLGGLSWCLAGCLWCITVVGIPVGMQCFKIAGLTFFSIREGSAVWRRRGFFFAESGLADPVWTPPGPGACGVRGVPLCDSHRDPFWHAAF